ncbi:hypothetical protein F5I97DRAFT_706942 [Phlebopus sp. FC_14]|nr:hypothetical protein F5I97DRAFT_706942 [Phlebopus sp. FC_14]
MPFSWTSCMVVAIISVLFMLPAVIISGASRRDCRRLQTCTGGVQDYIFSEREHQSKMKFHADCFHYVREVTGLVRCSGKPTGLTWVVCLHSSAFFQLEKSTSSSRNDPQCQQAVLKSIFEDARRRGYLYLCICKITGPDKVLWPAATPWVASAPENERIFALRYRP